MKLKKPIRLKDRPGEQHFLCPFHDDKDSPSLSINLDRQVYHCFGCKAGGDYVWFYAKGYNVSRKEAWKKIIRLDSGQSKKVDSAEEDLNFYISVAYVTYTAVYRALDEAAIEETAPGDLCVNWDYLAEVYQKRSEVEYILAVIDRYRWAVRIGWQPLVDDATPAMRKQYLQDCDERQMYKPNFNQTSDWSPLVHSEHYHATRVSWHDITSKDFDAKAYVDYLLRS